MKIKLADISEKDIRRFNAFIGESSKEKCWPWGSAINRDGYGEFSFKLKTTMAHRFSYVIHKGEIPQGLHIDHLCRNRSCVNPHHMELVTKKENTLRGIAPSARNAIKTHCKQGHEFTKENTYIRPDGTGRECRSCRKVRYVHKPLQGTTNQ